MIKAGTLKLHELVYRVSPKFPILICRRDYRVDFWHYFQMYMIIELRVTLVSDIIAKTLYTWCLINFVSQCFAGVRICRRILLT